MVQSKDTSNSVDNIIQSGKVQHKTNRAPRWESPSLLWRPRPWLFFLDVSETMILSLEAATNPQSWLRKWKPASSDVSHAREDLLTRKSTPKTNVRHATKRIRNFKRTKKSIDTTLWIQTININRLPGSTFCTKSEALHRCLWCISLKTFIKLLSKLN